MTDRKITYLKVPEIASSDVHEDTMEYGFIGTLQRMIFDGERFGAYKS